MPTDHPNVLVFFTDQQRWDTCGVHGNPMGLTPTFDRMAAFGTHLEHAFTCQPVCGPARSCLQSGRYATETGVYRNALALPEGAAALAPAFRDAGYATGYIGKWHLGDRESHGPVRKEQRGGFEYWLASNVLEFTSTAYDVVMYDNDNRPVNLPGYRVDALADAAIRSIAEGRDRPFFLFLSFIEPHQQNQVDDFVPPDGYRERYRSGWVPPDLAALGGSAQRHLAGYYGQVKRLDEALGRVLDALKSLGMLDNTVVLFTSDHGNHFRTRNREYKRSCHESSIRVPMAFTGPGFVGGGRRTDLVSLIDVPPTLLDAAGLPVPEAMQGRSILPLARGESNGWPDDVFVQISESQVARAVRTRRWKYSVTAPDKDGWNDSAADAYVEEYLYDLDHDPYELRNVVGMENYAEVSRVMRERLIRRMTEAGEPAPTIEPAPPKKGHHRAITPEEARM